MPPTVLRFQNLIIAFFENFFVIHAIGCFNLHPFSCCIDSDEQLRTKKSLELLCGALESSLVGYSHDYYAGDKFLEKIAPRILELPFNLKPAGFNVYLEFKKHIDENLRLLMSEELFKRHLITKAEAWLLSSTFNPMKVTQIQLPTLGLVDCYSCKLPSPRHLMYILGDEKSGPRIPRYYCGECYRKLIDFPQTVAPPAPAAPPASAPTPTYLITPPRRDNFPNLLNRVLSKLK
jgi:hypothetical protein